MIRNYVKYAKRGKTSSAEAKPESEWWDSHSLKNCVQIIPQQIEANLNILFKGPVSSITDHRELNANIHEKAAIALIKTLIADTSAKM